MSRDEDEDRRHSDLREAIDRIAQEAARHTAKRAARGYFLLVMVLLIGATVYGRVQEGKLHNGLMAACERINLLRIEESNRNAQVVWAALYRAAQRERALAASGVKRKLHQASADYIKTSIDAMRWTPETDCREAVNHPGTFRPPAPRKFDPAFLDFDRVPR